MADLRFDYPDEASSKSIVRLASRESRKPAGPTGPRRPAPPSLFERRNFSNFGCKPHRENGSGWAADDAKTALLFLQHGTYDRLIAIASLQAQDSWPNALLGRLSLREGHRGHAHARRRRPGAGGQPLDGVSPPRADREGARLAPLRAQPRRLRA